MNGLKSARHIALTLVAALSLLTGCMLLPDEDVELASVGKNRLMLSDIKELFAEGITSSDSLKLLQSYTQEWVRRQVKIQQAEQELTERTAQIEQMVNEYRNSLLCYNLDQHYLEGRVDTLVSDKDVAAYFAEHRNEFSLDRTLVKGRIVRVPDNFRQANKLFNLMRENSVESTKDYEEICAKNNFERHNFQQWVDAGEFLSYLPLRHDGDNNQLLAKRTVQELTDRDNRYFFDVTDCLEAGANAPFERVSEAVRRIIFNSRRNRLIDQYGDSLYHAAVEADMVKIKIDTTNNNIETIKDDNQTQNEN